VDSKYKRPADLFSPGFGDEAKIRHPGGVNMDDHIKDCTEGALREFVISTNSLLELLQRSRSSLTKLLSKWGNSTERSYAWDDVGFIISGVGPTTSKQKTNLVLWNR
jgi:hypothetical protein